MEQKASLIFEVVKEERRYQFIIPVGAPFGEVFDVAFELLNAAEQLQKQALDGAKKSLEESKEANAEVVA